MKAIHVTISPEGEITIEGKGFAGAECTKATAELEKALGVKTSDVKRPEFYQASKQGQQAGH